MNETKNEVKNEAKKRQMLMKMKNLKMKNRLLIWIAVLLIAGFSLGCGAFGVPPAPIPDRTPGGQAETPAPAEQTEPAAPAGSLTVHFIDVGQADSILVQAPSGKNMLIDAGNNADSALVENYLRAQGIEKLDILVGTHPHEDHIGGMDHVIKEFAVGQIVMPNVTTTTKTYRDVLTAIKDKGLKITAAKAGVQLDLGEGISASLLAPVEIKPNDLNNCSAVIRLVYGDVSFLFTGDSETESESEMISSKADLAATVLKVAHHGSRTSCSEKFLDRVHPQYAVISVGKDNDYGHPHPETLKKLSDRNIRIFRTDLDGTVIASTDGSGLTFSLEPEPSAQNTDKDKDADKKAKNENKNKQ